MRALRGAIDLVLRAAMWVALPLALLLFAQWPLRDLVQAYSREANDLGQLLFAAYVAVAVAVAMLATGLPSWLVLTGVAGLFAAAGVAAGLFPGALVAALPSRLLGLLESDLLQAMPLYVLMGALIHRLPLADRL